MKKFVYILTIVLLVLIFAVSAFLVGSYIVESREQAEQNAALAALRDNAKETTQEATDGTEPEETDPEGTFSEAEIRDENGMLAEYGEIYAQNSDLVGWIRIDGTKLDNPVVQTPDRPNYYLDHDFYGTPSAWGAIYAREECDIYEPSDNITLYGHNMRDGSMFAVLNDYTNKATWENNPLIFFDTLYEYHVYKIFAVFKTSANLGEGFTYHNMIEAENKADFDEFIATAKELSFYDTGITPQYGDKVICLSTCEYTLDNGRLVMAAVRIS
ncbi:MAG: class B sortase [Oscillospiraceae bacterium]|nr:class B sortase [Oscillospiraceae bacterium]